MTWSTIGRHTWTVVKFIALVLWVALRILVAFTVALIIGSVRGAGKSKAV